MAEPGPKPRASWQMEDRPPAVEKLLFWKLWAAPLCQSGDRLLDVLVYFDLLMENVKSFEHGTHRPC